MWGIAEIAALITQLLKIVELLHQHYNDPAIVSEKVKQMTQNAADQVEELQKVLRDPNASKADKDAAFNKIRLLDS